MDPENHNVKDHLNDFPWRSRLWCFLKGSLQIIIHLTVHDKLLVAIDVPKAVGLLWFLGCMVTCSTTFKTRLQNQTTVTSSI